MARDNGSVRLDRDGDDDYSYGGSGGLDVTDRVVRNGRYGFTARDRDDGGGDGSVCEFHKSDFSPCKHSGYGPRRLSLRRLPKSRRTTYNRRLHNRDGAPADTLAVASGLILRTRCFDLD